MRTCWIPHALKNNASATALLLFFLMPILGQSNNTYASERCESTVAQLVSVQGSVETRHVNETIWRPATMNSTLCSGDMVRVRSYSRASLRLSNESMLRLDQRTTITFTQPPPQDQETSLLNILKGAIHIITRTPKPFKVRTPFLNATVDGTEFFVGVDDNSAKVVVYEGQVTAANDQGSTVLIDNEAAVAKSNQAPQKEIIIRPVDAVQWALYYPQIIENQSNAKLQSDDEISTLIHQAVRLLAVGQVNEAKIILEQVNTLEPNNSDTFALQAIIAVVQNEKKQALNLSDKAIELDPTSSAARISLSYAQQAHFEIEAALASIQEAVLLDPNNALIWARLSELQMSVGNLDHALSTAQQAVNLNANLAKTQTVLGFAHLLQIDTQTAKTIFNKAIQLDQADPMPRLGMGLALIREGSLEAGRVELEIAASLDPANSLIRSYLGKAYFEEKRYPLAETQFELAKARDPFDPTPWFYDAIQKQTQNRPVEALQDIQKSIELNDNRALYRSKLLLDQDQAGRSSSLARIYDNLGFGKRALMETAKSLSHDPSNHSAHRFLADTYTNIPRHEAARVSELLQAQLMQPINVNPVQPHLAVADLNIITNTGPSAAGFNEFAPLMERNRSQLVASGFGGNNSTFGNEVVFSKLYERTSVSLGQFHYQTDGFRTNNDQNHDILNAFIQHALTPKLNIQAEIRTRKTDQGNLLLDFDRDSRNPFLFKNRLRRKLDENVARIGARYSLTPNQHILMSGQYLDKKDKRLTFINFRDTVTSIKDEGYQAEIQYQFRSEHFNLLAGSGIHRIDAHQTKNIINQQLLCSLGCETNNFSMDRTNGYIYGNINLSPNLIITTGFSYDVYKERGLVIDRFNPKFGIQWNVSNNARLRFAWMEGIKAPLLTQQTIEPTQVSGFNQIYDDTNGTKYRRVGIGLDTHYANKIFSGFEISDRNLVVPEISINNSLSNFEKQKEKLYRAYLYGLLHPNWTAKSEAQYEQFSRDETSVGPHQIDTLSIPTRISYFNPQGVFANLTGTFVHQKVARRGTQNEGIENFFLVDASVGYRLPNRRGVLSIEGRNLFDQSFLFRNMNFVTSEPINSRFVPTRTIFARLTLNF